MFRNIVKQVSFAPGTLTGSTSFTAAAQLSSASPAHFSSDPFSAANLARTLKELNDESTRKIFGSFEADGTARQSSVLIPLCQHKGEPTILFNLRSNRLTRHKGYPCFPGGVAEESDLDSVHTALRETHEELGLAPQSIKVIGTFPRFKMPRDNMEITAVIADIGDIDSHTLNINYDEVSLVFSRTIKELTSTENTGPYKIWGVTAMLLHILLGRLVPDLYIRPLRPIVFHKTYEPIDISHFKAKNNSP
ncbi:nucleoside diphosphate-linked moiety X motif 8 [Tropilaelaps mercedesae]|uniref:Nucleoside diphosphate-linked moiety X motif 8 n=1 Tax=Tropilaelaps mercedesae TaxID=418985 RepID=A0A1V9XHS2_9ACAR|nr:nucleoside diphosphate-linked moiety X motif 8 [Tropilaelaps mercedesae]